MTEIFGIPTAALFGQLLIGLINGSFYALLSLGLAVIFGLLRVINFAHGAQYMLGAFVAFLGLKHLGIPYWAALVVAPLVVGAFGALRLRSPLDRLHAVAFVNVAAGIALAAAAFLEDGVSTRSIKLACLVAVVLVMGAAASHAAGRAILLRDGPQA